MRLLVHSEELQNSLVLGGRTHQGTFVSKNGRWENHWLRRDTSQKQVPMRVRIERRSIVETMGHSGSQSICQLRILSDSLLRWEWGGGGEREGVAAWVILLTSSEDRRRVFLQRNTLRGLGGRGLADSLPGEGGGRRREEGEGRERSHCVRGMLSSSGGRGRIFL